MKTNQNEITNGFSGKLKNVSFRQWYGRTQAMKPRRKSSKAPTAAQDAVNARFKRAVGYAKSIMADPVMLAFYSRKAKDDIRPFNVAIADYFQAPVIEEIETNRYSGAAGGLISVFVTDDFKVADVRFKISKPDGSLLEEGQANMQADEQHWHYLTTADNNSLAGTKISVYASDLPGNLVTKTITI